MTFNSFREFDPKLKDFTDSEIAEVVRQSDKKLAGMNDAEIGYIANEIGAESILGIQKTSTDGINNPGDIGSMGNLAFGSLVSASGYAGKDIAQRIADSGSPFNKMMEDDLARITGREVNHAEENTYQNDVMDSVIAYGDRVRKNVNPEFSEAMDKRFFDKDNNLQGENSAWSDPRAITGTVASGLAQFIPSAIAILVTKNPMAGAAIAAEMEAGSARDEVYKTVTALDFDVLNTSPLYQDLIKDGVAPEDARKKVAFDLAKSASDQTAIISGALEYIGGKYLLDGVFGNITGNVAKKLGVQTLAQGGTEGVQGLAQQGIKNYNVQQADERVNVTDDLANSATQEAIGGIGMAGVIGGYDAYANRGTDQANKEQPTNLDDAQAQSELDAKNTNDVDAVSQAVNNAVGEIDLLTGKPKDTSKTIQEQVEPAQQDQKVDLLKGGFGIQEQIDTVTGVINPELDAMNAKYRKAEHYGNRPAYQGSNPELFADQFGLPILPGKLEHKNPVKEQAGVGFDAQQERYALDDTVPNPTIPKQAADLPKIPSNYHDMRLQNPYYRDALQNMANELERDSGGILIPDTEYRLGESDKPGGYPMKRTASNNPDWFKSGAFTYENANGNQSTVGVAAFQKAIDDALAGNPLKESQKRIVTEALNLGEADVQSEIQYEQKVGKIDYEQQAIDRQEQLDRDSIEQYFSEPVLNGGGNDVTANITEAQVDKALTKLDSGKAPLSVTEKNIVKALDNNAWQTRNPKGNGRSNGLRDVLNAMPVQEKAETVKTERPVNTTIEPIEETKESVQDNVQQEVVKSFAEKMKSVRNEFDAAMEEGNTANAQKANARARQITKEQKEYFKRDKNIGREFINEDGKTIKIIERRVDDKGNDRYFTEIDGATDFAPIFESSKIEEEIELATKLNNSRIESNKKRNAEQVARHEQELKEKMAYDEKMKYVNEFLKDENNLVRGKKIKTLSMEERVDGDIITRSEKIEMITEQGYKPLYVKIDGRTQYRLADGSGSIYTVTKTEFDYAKWLLDNSVNVKKKDVASEVQDIKVSASGNPFKSEKSARMSKTFKSIPNAEIVPVDGGFGVREGANNIQSVQQSKESNKEAYKHNGNKSVAENLSEEFKSIPKTARDSDSGYIRDIEFSNGKTSFKSKALMWFDGGIRPRIATRNQSGDFIVLSLTGGKSINGSSNKIYTKFNVLESGEKARLTYGRSYNRLNKADGLDVVDNEVDSFNNVGSNEVNQVEEVTEADSVIEGAFKEVEGAIGSNSGVWMETNKARNIIADALYETGVMNAREKFVRDINPRAGDIETQQREAIEQAKKDLGIVVKRESKPNQENQVQNNETLITEELQQGVDSKEEVADISEDTNYKPDKEQVQESRKGQEKPAQKIEDFGEKLGGARKDLEYEAKLSNAGSMKTQPLSKSFPKPDTQKMLNEGIDPRVVAFVYAIRENLPSKPRKSWKLDRWVEKAEMARNISEQLVSGELDIQVFYSKALERENIDMSSSELAGIMSSVMLANEVPKTKEAIEGLSNYRINQNTYSMITIDGVKYNDKTVTDVIIKGKAAGFGGLGNRNHFETTQEASDMVKKAVSEISAHGKKIGGERKIKFDVYSNRYTRAIYIAKKAGKNIVRIKDGFDSASEAREYINNNYEELAAIFESKKLNESVRYDQNRDRVGDDYRDGENVTPELFSETFGFRGVEFGNWVGDSRRQQDLNDAYDGLMDLANIIGISPKALSLDGKLGLAFGARGKGGKRAAKAHYESDKEVINLTKNKGAGSLAHEWFHAMDNYFAKMEDASKTDGGRFATEMKRKSHIQETPFGKWRESESGDFSIRQEVFDAFKNLEKALTKETEILKRSENADETRSKEYWSTIREITARSFERYVIGKLGKESYLNDYLANVINQEKWQNELGASLDYYQYPLDNEMEVVNAAYDNLFETIEQKETENGNVALFSTTDPKQSTADTGNNPLSIEVINARIADINLGLRVVGSDATVQVHTDISNLPDAIKSEAAKQGASNDFRGVYYSGKVHVLAPRINSELELNEVILHELEGHFGVRKLFGKETADKLNQIYTLLGGEKGIRRFIKNNGITMPEVYFEESNQRAIDNNDQKAKSIFLADEFLAHVQGTKAVESLPQAIKRRWNELKAIVAKKLRDFGLNKAAELVETNETIVYGTLRQMRKAVHENVEAGDIGGSLFSMLEKDNGNAAFDPEQADSPNIMFSRKELDNDIQDDGTLESFRSKFGRKDAITSIKDAIGTITENLGLKIRQGVFDKYASLLKLDMQVYGEDVVKDSTTHSAWVLAKMSESGQAALSVMMQGGRIKYSKSKKLVEADTDTDGFLVDMGKILGSSEELDQFFRWVAANRSSELMKADKEHLFTEKEIEFGLTENQGKLSNGKSREEAYARAHEKFKMYHNDVLDIATNAGLVSKEDRATWESQFYVPFYRVMEDGSVNNHGISGASLKPKEAYKALKGGTQNINDLLENTLMNWNHLLTNSMRNMATQQAITNSVLAGVAEITTQDSKVKTKTHVFVNGQKVVYEIKDQLVFDSLTMLSNSGFNGATMKAARAFKRVFTQFTTVSPQFIAANLIRDSLQAVAVTDGSDYNVLKNVWKGGRKFGAGLSKNMTPDRARIMAAGGSFSFGYVYGRNSDDVKYSIDKTLGNVIRTPLDAKGATKIIGRGIRTAWDKYQAINNMTENVNRMSIYNTIKEETGNELYAALQARDLMDFSAHGSFQAIRFLTDVVPFLNARLQGLDKIYRSGVKPSSNALRAMFGGKDASVTDKQLAKRFAAVTGALTLATLALRADNEDDEEYRKLEDWQKDSYWYFRVDDNAFFIPKPFEVGAIATVAERTMEQAISDHPEVDAKLFWTRISDMMLNTFSFDPTPQIVKPMLEVYANENSFTGRPIETVGMQLSNKPAEYKYHSGTSESAKFLSNVTSFTGDYNLSPVQYDHLISGYLGWVGTTANGHITTIANMAQGKEAPDKDWYEYQPARRFYRDLDKPTYTKYSSMFYDYLKETKSIYAEVKAMRDEGLDYKAFMEDNKSKLKYRVYLAGVQKKVSSITKRMNIIKKSNMPGAVKRQRLDLLQTRKNRLQEIAVKKYIRAN